MEQQQFSEEKYPVFLRLTMRLWVKVYWSFVEFVRPLFDFVARFLVAQFFFRSAVAKLFDWSSALALARYEYPVAWMAPETAAVTGVVIELVGSLLLIIGLATRGAALAMGALLLVSQIEYIPTDTNLFLIALLGWYAVRGAGALSLDRAIAGGLSDSALIFSAPLSRFFAASSAYLAPLWLVLVRFWLALTLIAEAGLFIVAPQWFPLAAVSGFQPILALILAILLLIGFAIPWSMLILIAGIGASLAMGYHPNLILFPALLFGLLALYGAGWLSVDAAFRSWLERTILFDRQFDDVPDRWPHIIVVGAGFGGLAAVRKLRNLPVRITLIDRQNYHLFQPLLYQIATAALSPADVAMPIRSLFRNDGNVRVLLGEVDAIDSRARAVCIGESRLSYDYLLLATGASHSYFGKDQWEPYAPGLKTIEDGLSVRARVLRAFEHAESSDNSAEIERLLTFVIIGAGPTGVELAGAIAELAQFGLKNEYRRIDPAKARILLVQSGTRVLPTFASDLSGHAARSLDSLGVEILLESRVTDIGADYVRVGENQTIACGTVLWAAGVVASKAGEWLNAKTDRAGRIIVDENLKVVGHEAIFAIGDTAHSLAWDGGQVPGLAPAAKQAGAYFARYIGHELRNDKKTIAPFHYRHQGSLATIGRKHAVADLGGLRLHGSLAWWLWGAIHIGFLSGIRTRISVLVNWVWSYLTFQQGIRLITTSRTTRSGE